MSWQYSDFNRFKELVFLTSDPERAIAESARGPNPEIGVLATFVARIFEDSAQLAAEFTPDQLAVGIGYCARQFRRLDRVPADTQRRILRGTIGLYRDVLSLEAESSQDGSNANSLMDETCLKLWDSQHMGVWASNSDLSHEILRSLIIGLVIPSGRVRTSAQHGMERLARYSSGALRLRIEKHLAEHGEILETPRTDSTGISTLSPEPDSGSQRVA